MSSIGSNSLSGATTHRAPPGERVVGRPVAAAVRGGRSNPRPDPWATFPLSATRCAKLSRICLAPATAWGVRWPRSSAPQPGVAGPPQLNSRRQARGRAAPASAQRHGPAAMPNCRSVLPPSSREVRCLPPCGRGRKAGRRLPRRLAVGRGRRTKTPGPPGDQRARRLSGPPAVSRRASVYPGAMGRQGGGDQAAAQRILRPHAEQSYPIPSPVPPQERSPCVLPAAP
jgi:hypothetical protein